jgi:iodotyrosine deiodinase
MRDHPAIPLSGYEAVASDEMQARAAAFLAALSRRRTVRDFSERAVPREAIETCLLAAGTAPSGANRQPWFFTVIGDPVLKREIRLAAEAEERAFYAEKAPPEWLAALEPLGTDPEKPFLEAAPWLIAIFGRKREADGAKNYYVAESVGISVGLLIAALHSAGLATLTHTPAPMTFLNQLCGRPASEKPFLLLVVGYPAEGATVPLAALDKKPLDQIAEFR